MTEAGDEPETERVVEDEAELPPRNRRLTPANAAKIAFLLLALGLGVYAVADQWTQVRADLADIGVPALVAAVLLTLPAWFAMMATWRGLLADFGSRLPWRGASHVFFLGQLGKYIPGSVWPVLAQMELGRAYHVPRHRSAAVAILAMLVSLEAALVVAASTLPWAGGRTGGYSWAFLAAPFLLALLHPRIANPVLDWLFRVTRRPPLEHPLTGRAILAAVARNVTAWLLAGLHVWLLAVRLGAPVGRTFLLAVGGFAFAWSVGFLVVLAPAGAGIRELILIAALSPVLSTSQATAVALASRLVTIVADLVWAGVAGSATAAAKRRPVP
jgi:glycosyltransferase 2 family protein